MKISSNNIFNTIKEVAAFILFVPMLISAHKIKTSTRNVFDIVNRYYRHRVTALTVGIGMCDHFGGASHIYSFLISFHRRLIFSILHEYNKGQLPLVAGKENSSLSIKNHLNITQ